MKRLLLTPIFKRFKKSAFFSSLNQNSCPVYDAEEIKKQEQKEATYRINFCREETKKAIPKLVKKLPEGVVLDEERIESLTSVFPLQYLSMFEQLSKYKK